MTGLTARASIRNRSERLCCHERKKKLACAIRSVGKATNGQCVGLVCTLWEFWGADWSAVREWIDRREGDREVIDSTEFVARNY